MALDETYSVLIDWAGDGNFTEPDDDVSPRVLVRSPVSIQYGRDQARSLSPMAVGSASFELDNTSRDYSPENSLSPIAEYIRPARPVVIEADIGGGPVTLFRGYTDDYDLRPDVEDRTVGLTALDGLAKLRDVNISTRLRESIRTGEAINNVLDEIGWPEELRDIDTGASLLRFWWEEGTDAFAAVEKIVHSEGPGAIAYTGPDGEFIFRGRHHRLLDTRSRTSQYTFRCEGAEPLLTRPLVYDVGWRDIVNSVELTIDERQEVPDRDVVWSDPRAITLAAGESRTIQVRTNDPFNNGRTPVEGVDYEVTYGTVSVSLFRNSGQSTTITVTAGSSAAEITNLQFAASSVSVSRSVVVSGEESTSIERYGKRSYPDSLEWACKNDAEALVPLILAQRAERLPIVTITIAGSHPTRMAAMLDVRLSDRITIVEDETGLSRDFFVEQIRHEFTGPDGQHRTTLGCEAIPAADEDVFRLDVGQLDVNELGQIGIDDPDNIFIFGDAIQGQFGTGFFAH